MKRYYPLYCQGSDRSGTHASSLTAGWHQTLESVWALSEDTGPTYEGKTGSSTGRAEDIVEALVRSRNPSHLHHHPHSLLDGLGRLWAESTSVTDIQPSCGKLTLLFLISIALNSLPAACSNGVDRPEIEGVTSNGLSSSNGPSEGIDEPKVRLCVRSGRLKLGIRTRPILFLLESASASPSSAAFFLFSPRLPGVVFFLLSVCGLSGPDKKVPVDGGGAYILG